MRMRVQTQVQNEPISFFFVFCLLAHQSFKMRKKNIRNSEKSDLSFYESGLETMIQKPIRDFLVENAIEERIPYFGRARLYTVPMAQLRRSPFQLPREIFHFVTAVYLIINAGASTGVSSSTYELRINSYRQKVDASDFSDVSHQNNDRKNILVDPIFLGMNTFIAMVLVDDQCKESAEEEGVISLLVEYAKISPESYRVMHQNDIVLVSKQREKEILQFRGNSP
jgi:hypothetical protein